MFSRQHTKVSVMVNLYHRLFIFEEINSPIQIYIVQFNSIQFALFIYTQYIYSVNMGSNRNYNRKKYIRQPYLDKYTEDMNISRGRTVHIPF